MPLGGTRALSLLRTYKQKRLFVDTKRWGGGTFCAEMVFGAR